MSSSIHVFARLVLLSALITSANSLAAEPATQRSVPATAPSSAAEKLFQKASPAVVRVEVQDEKMVPVAFGSGFFISADGLIVTNYHVIRGASFASIKRADGSTQYVEGIVASDPEIDLAVLKVKGKNFPSLNLADSSASAHVGMEVFAIGNPKGFTNTLSEGLVSGLRTEDAVSLIQTTAPISHGSSGGPLMNADAVVIGVTTGMREDGQNLNFAIPAAQVQALLKKKGAIRTLASAAAEQFSADDKIAFADVLLTLRGDPAHAIAVLNTMRDREQNNPLFWFSMACVHFELVNKDLAIDAAKHAIKLDENMAPAHDLLASMYVLTGKYDLAIGELKALSKLSQGDPGAYRRAGSIYTSVKNYNQAIRFYDFALKLDPKDAATHALKGEALSYLDRRDEAMKCFNESLRLAPDSTANRMLLAAAYARWKRFGDAKREYVDIISRHPDSALAYLGLGYVDAIQRDASGARAAWRNAVRFDPRGITGRVARQQLDALDGIASIRE